RLDYVGPGPLLPAAGQFVHAFGLGERVCLHGGLSSDRVASLMREADIFLQHSITDPTTGDEEGMPVAMREAMAAALPVVATRHAGVPEAVREGQTAVLVDEGATEAMGEAITELADDPVRRRAMGVAGWERAFANFTWAREQRELLTLLYPGGKAAAARAEARSSWRRK